MFWNVFTWKRFCPSLEKADSRVKIDQLFNFVDDLGLAEIIDTQMEILNI